MNLERIRNIALVALILLILGMAAGAVALGGAYRDLIYPGVTVAGRDLGGLTKEEAVRRVAAALPSPDEQVLTVRIAERTWQITWAMAGQSYDVPGAVEEAYAVGRERAWWLGILSLVEPVSVAVPVPVNPPDPSIVRAYVEKIADQVASPPVDAALTIVGGEIVAAPGRDGARLDVDAATDAVIAALQAGSDEISLDLTPIPPRRATAEPAASEARALLAQPHMLIVDDPLTGDVDAGGYHAEFPASAERMSNWLDIVPTDAGFALQRRPEIIRAWVEEIAPQVGQARRLDVEATYQRLLASLDAGEGQTAAEIYHPPLTYTVDFGDTFYDIAYGFGFPQWHLEQANPDVEPGQIDVGQVLTIPSLDVLFPHPLVDHKRIEIDLPTQTLYAFEDNTQIFEFKVSSGISSTPTIAGQFQVLFKEEAAFAQRWSLDMPYFMGFYEEGEGFYNGIHELPITSRGVRLPSGVLGWPASYGCIILDEGDAESLYRWADVGTLVRVKGVAPGTPYGQQTLSDIAPPTPQEASP